MKILTNSGRVDINDVRSNNGKIVDFVYMNNVLVWQRMLILHLSQHHNTFSLRTFINDKNINNVKQITVINDRTQPAMVTGNLSGLDVTFINNGEIQAMVGGGNAFHATSPIKLINNGWIRGSGGKGGAGGKGKNTSKTSYSYEIKYNWKACNQATSGNYWVGVINYTCDTMMTWGGKHSSWLGDVGTDWKTISGLSGHFRRTGGVLCNTMCSHQSSFYRIERRLTHTTAITGGAGGAGGAGIGYNSVAKNGSAGKASSPSGGNSGGTGGRGGSWGAKGSTGSTGAGGGSAGSVGASGGLSILGRRYLTTGSSTGSVNGSIAN